MRKLLLVLIGITGLALAACLMDRYVPPALEKACLAQLAEIESRDPSSWTEQDRANRDYIIATFKK